MELEQSVEVFGTEGGFCIVDQGSCLCSVCRPRSDVSSWHQAFFPDIAGIEAEDIKNPLSLKSSSIDRARRFPHRSGTMGERSLKQEWASACRNSVSRRCRRAQGRRLSDVGAGPQNDVEGRGPHFGQGTHALGLFWVYDGMHGSCVCVSVAWDTQQDPTSRLMITAREEVAGPTLCCGHTDHTAEWMYIAPACLVQPCDLDCGVSEHDCFSLS